MSSKYEVDIEKLKDITGENKSYSCPEELIPERDRINGMIRNNVMFCALITGYRGTGKTTFVNNIINNLPKDVITVVINAAKYKSYEVFMKRFIRELFLKYRVDKKVGQDKPESIKHLYLHTFYNFKNINSLDTKRDNEKSFAQCNKKIITGKVNINIQKILGFFLYMIFNALFLWVSNMMEQQFLGLISVFITTVLYIISNIKISTDYEFNNEKIHSQSEMESIIEEKKIHIENLYDDEIAEYHLFNAIKEISIKHKRELLLVLDEMDKIENKEDLQKIFRELKPLFLSKYCNVIVVAGKTVDALLFEEEGKEDSVIDSLFSKKIYVPLCTLDENKIFMETLFTEESFLRIRTNSAAQSYLRRTVILANGNRRKLINLLLSDIVWENNKPYIFLENVSQGGDFDKLYNVMSKMEEFIFNLYKDIESDEAIYHTYQLLNYIRKQKGNEFRKEQILDWFRGMDEFRLCAELCDEILKSMEAEKLVQCLEGKFTWINENNEENGIKVNYSKISESLSNVRTLERLFVCFGVHWGNGRNVFECIDYCYKNEIIREEELKQLEECFKVLKEIEEKDIDNVRLHELYNNIRKLKRRRGYWAEKMLCWTINKDSSYIDIKPEDIKQLAEIDNWKYHYGRYDAIFYDPEQEKILITEVKFYQNYMSGINSRISEMLNELEFISYQCRNINIRIEFLLVFLVDASTPSVRKLLEDSIKRVISGFYGDDEKKILRNTHIEVISLNDSFNDDIERMMSHLR